MAPKSKTKAKSTVGAKARAKAGSGASSPEPKSKAKAKAQPGEELPEKKNRKQKAEALLRECLAEPDIARVDGRVLDIAVLDGKTKVVDAELLSKAEHRLQEWHAFQEELQKIAEELRVQKAEVVARHDEENVLFHSACDTRQGLKKRIEELFSAIENGELNKVKAWYRDCVSIEPDGDYPAPPLPLDVEDHEVTTPLAEAAAYGEVEIVQFLLEHGAHPDCVNCHGKSSLYRSTSCGTEREQEIVEILLEHGADPLAGEVEVGKYGTDGTKKLIGSWSKDHTAERKEKLRPLQRLREPWPRHLTARTLPAAQHCRERLTCLMIACRKGHTAIVKELLQNGAKTYLRSEQERLASDYAREAGHALHDLVVQHCRRTQDWSTLEEEARQHEGNKTCGVDAIEDLLENRRNVAASHGATLALRSMDVSEIREGSDRYKQLLEECALADVLGFG